MPTNQLADAFSRFILDLVRISMDQIEAERQAAAPQEPAIGPALLDRKAAAEYLAIGTTTLDDLRKAGEFKVVTIKGVPKYPRKELDRYVERLRKGG